MLSFGLHWITLIGKEMQENCEVVCTTQLNKVK